MQTSPSGARVVPVAPIPVGVRIGAVLWIVVPVMNFALQVIVVQAWQVPYYIADHTVSDLGYTTCVEESRPGGLLKTCSPLHALFNLGGVVQYMMVGTGVVLLASRYRWSGVTVAAGLVMAAGGVAVSVAAGLVMAAGGVAVSVVPGDVNITAHALLALPLFFGGLALLILAAWQSRRTGPSRSRDGGGRCRGDHRGHHLARFRS